jgi:hypothetical protein
MVAERNGAGATLSFHGVSARMHVACVLLLSLPHLPVVQHAICMRADKEGGAGRRGGEGGTGGGETNNSVMATEVARKDLVGPVRACRSSRSTDAS